MASSGPVKIAIIGCGNRGKKYASFTHDHPELCKVVAIAEPRKITRDLIANHYSVPSEFVFEDWKQVASLDKKIADVVIICTQDKMHTAPAIAFANLGYHILLEKPMATTAEECKQIYDAVKKNNKIFAIGHVLRYTNYSRKVKELIQSGKIGDIVCIQHLEPVGYWHQAHSYVRGNWRNEEESSFMLLAKSCHDIDWILWIMDKKLLKVSSFGALKHFRKEEKPANAASRCLDCSLKETCPYSAKRIYLDRIKKGETGFPVHVIAEIPTVESVTEALQNGPYGRCVYDCDNDVVDNQVVNMLFEGGRTASFTMIAFSEEICVRKTRIFGTKGELEGDGENKIKVYDFVTEKETIYHPDPNPESKLCEGHGGGDYYLIKSFIEAVQTGDRTKICSPEATLESHLAVFEAEKSRLNDTVNKLSW